MFEGVSLKVRVIFTCMTAGGLLLPLFFMAYFSRVEPIDARVVFGCYTAPGAPSLDIKADAIHIVEPLRRKFDYVAEPFKLGYHLKVHPALGLVPKLGGGYVFAETRGSGFFWSLLPTDGKNQNRLQRPQDYAGQFEMFATDGARVVYTRVDALDPCR